MTGAAEPVGLGMSLDDLIKKKEKPSGAPGRGAGRGLAAQGGVIKSPGRGLGRGAGRASDGGGRGGPRTAAFVGGRGGGRAGVHEAVAPSGGRGGSGGPSGTEVENIRLRAQVAQQQSQIRQQQEQIMALTHQIGMALAAQAGGAMPIPARAINPGARQNRAPIVPELEPIEMDQDILQNMEIKDMGNGDYEVRYQVRGMGRGATGAKQHG